MGARQWSSTSTILTPSFISFLLSRTRSGHYPTRTPMCLTLRYLHAAVSCGDMRTCSDNAFRIQQWHLVDSNQSNRSLVKEGKVLVLVHHLWIPRAVCRIAAHSMHYHVQWISSWYGAAVLHMACPLKQKWYQIYQTSLLLHSIETTSHSTFQRCLTLWRPKMRHLKWSRVIHASQCHSSTVKISWLTPAATSSSTTNRRVSCWASTSRSSKMRLRLVALVGQNSEKEWWIKITPNKIGSKSWTNTIDWRCRGLSKYKLSKVIWMSLMKSMQMRSLSLKTRRQNKAEISPKTYSLKCLSSMKSFLSTILGKHKSSKSWKSCSSRQNNSIKCLIRVEHSWSVSFGSGSALIVTSPHIKLSSTRMMKRSMKKALMAHDTSSSWNSPRMESQYASMSMRHRLLLLVLFMFFR